MDLTTNVTRITNTLLKYGFVPNNQLQTVNGFTLLPQDWLCPKDYETKVVNITPNTLCIHHFDGSWVPKGMKVKEKIQRILGRRLTKLFVKIKRSV